MVKKISEIPELLKLFRNELEAPEKNDTENNLSENKLFSSSALHTFSDNKKNNRDSNLRQNNNQKYCGNSKKSFEKHARGQQQPLCISRRRSHKSFSCDIVTKTEVRKNIIKKEKRYFKCLKQGHLISESKSNFTVLNVTETIILLFVR